MYAEAENEVNEGPTEDEYNALKKVHNRAFSGNKTSSIEWYDNAMNSKEDFLNAVLTERKFEFPGENMRWKDLVRNNQYSEKLF